jgi:hypothetical protein
MKRSLIRALMVAAAMAVGASAFAQLAFNGYYRVGSMSNVDSGGNEATAFQDRIRLNISFAAADDMYGFKTRLQKDSSGTTSALVGLFTNGVASTGTTNLVTGATTIANTVTAPADIRYGYGYAKLLDGMVKLSAGYLDLTDYSVAENTGNYYFGKVYTDDLTGANTGIQSGQTGRYLGTALQVWPIEGLSVAATIRTDGSTIAAHHLGFDAYYLLPGIGKAIIASQFGLYSSTAASASNDLAKSFVSAGFQYLGLAGLSATAALRSTYVNNAEAFGAIAILEYGAGPLFANLSTDVDLTNSHYYFEGEVAYLVIPQVKIRGYGAYNDVPTGSIAINGINNKYSVGADLVLPVGKSEIQAGVVYGDQANLQFPILIKANF